MKRLFTLALAAMLLFALAGCTQPTPAPAETAAPAPAEPTPEELPQQEEGTAPEDVSVDIVVVGGGAAGLSAAIEAATSGANVMLIEKNDMLGGSTILSGGALVRNATEEEEASSQALRDDKLLSFYLDNAKQDADPTIIQNIIDHSIDSIDWLLDMGYSRNTMFYEVGDDILMVEWGESGAQLIESMAKGAESVGVNIMMGTAATELILENGEVSGIKAEGKDGAFQINANAVVLATGGFAMNAEMVGEHTNLVDVLGRVSGSGCVGDGIKMAESVNAKTKYKGACLNSAWNIQGTDVSIIGLPPHLLVSDAGQRVTNEKQFYSLVSNDMEKSGASNFFLVFESEYAPDAMDANVEAGTAWKADTLEDLAAQLNMDAAALKATAERYTELKGNEDADFGKDTSHMTGMENGPFYAIGCKPMALGTFGGLCIDVDSRVLDQNDQPIANLFAAGEVANADFFGEVYPVSGSCIQHAVTTGRIAGRNAAK